MLKLPTTLLQTATRLMQRGLQATWRCRKSWAQVGDGAAPQSPPVKLGPIGGPDGLSLLLIAHQTSGTMGSRTTCAMLLCLYTLSAVRALTPDQVCSLQAQCPLQLNALRLARPATPRPAPAALPAAPAAAQVAGRLGPRQLPEHQQPTRGTLRGCRWSRPRRRGWMPRPCRPPAPPWSSFWTAWT